MKAVFVALFALVAVASAGVLVPQTYSLSYSAPLYAPLTYHSAASAIQPGYVAATRGSLHTAPLPEGPLAYSHHINTAAAPGTY